MPPLTIKALKGMGKIAKDAGNAIAVDKHLPRIVLPGRKSTQKIDDLNGADSNLTKDVAIFIELAGTFQEIAKGMKYSYLEKISREAKIKCKSISNKIIKEIKAATAQEAQNKAENKKVIYNLEIYPKYVAIRNAYLNKLHKILEAFETISTNENIKNLQEIASNQFNLPSANKTLSACSNGLTDKVKLESLKMQQITNIRVTINN